MHDLVQHIMMGPCRILAAPFFLATSQTEKLGSCIAVLAGRACWLEGIYSAWRDKAAQPSLPVGHPRNLKLSASPCCCLPPLRLWCPWHIYDSCERVGAKALLLRDAWENAWARVGRPTQQGVAPLASAVKEYKEVFVSEMDTLDSQSPATFGSRARAMRDAAMLLNGAFGHGSRLVSRIAELLGFQVSSVVHCAAHQDLRDVTGFAALEVKTVPREPQRGPMLCPWDPIQSCLLRPYSKRRPSPRNLLQRRRRRCHEILRVCLQL